MEPNAFARLLMSIPWFGWVAMVAIVCGTVTRCVAMGHAHEERMEKIRQEMNPDGGKSSLPEI